MSKLAALIRTGLKSNFGLALYWHRFFREKKDRWVLPLIGCSLLGFIPMLYGFVEFIRSIYFVLKPLGQERALLAFGVMAGQLIILIFGLYYVISAFYFARDLEMLIPLPVKPSEVLVSKFAVIIVNEYLTVAAIVLPFIITFGVLDKGGLDYWISAALVYLALPILPLVIVTVIVVAMMRLINISRKKDLLVFIGGIAIIAAALGFQFLTQRAGNGLGGPQEMAAFFASPDNLLNRVGATFPPSIWATKAFAGGFSREGLTNLAIFLAVSLLLLSAMIVVVEQLYYRGVVGLTETSGKKRRLTRDEMSRRISSGRHAISAIFMREVRIMNRTPPFLLNGVLGVFILPVIVVLMTKTNANKGDIPLQGLFASGNSILILPLALFMILCGHLNGTSSSTFSREGSQFWVSRVIPVAPQEQVAAKFLHSYLIGILGIIAALVALVIFFPFKPLHVAVAAGLAMVAGIALTAIGMIIDLARPLLDWTNPQKAMKQNLNVLLAMLADAGILAAAFFGTRALIKSEVETNAIIGLLFLAFGAFSALACLALLKFADKRYREIEN
jgi:ABC-2 type transport system permease protein